MPSKAAIHPVLLKAVYKQEIIIKLVKEYTKIPAGFFDSIKKVRETGNITTKRPANRAGFPIVEKLLLNSKGTSVH